MLLTLIGYSISSLHVCKLIFTLKWNEWSRTQVEHWGCTCMSWLASVTSHMLDYQWLIHQLHHYQLPGGISSCISLHYLNFPLLAFLIQLSFNVHVWVFPGVVCSWEIPQREIFLASQLFNMSYLHWSSMKCVWLKLQTHSQILNTTAFIQNSSK